MNIQFKQPNSSKILFCIVIGCFLYLLSASWLKWGDLVIDTSRELWVPLQILKGKVVYKDLFYEYGFLSPYILASVYKIFGVSIYSLIGVGIAITVLMTALLYKISRFFLDEIISFLVVVTFMFVFAFGFYGSGIFNFILPYSFASTFFTLFITAAVYYFLRFIYGEKARHLLLWAVSLTAAFLCRADMSFPVWLGFVLIGEVLILKTNRKNIRRFNLYLVSPFVAGILCYALFIAKMQAFAGFKESVIDFVSFAVTGNSLFNICTMGIDRAVFNIWLMFKSFIFHLIDITLLGTGVFLISSFFLKKKEESSFILSLGGIIIIVFAFIFAQNYLARSFLQYRCLPLLLLIGLCIFCVRTFKGSDFKKNISSLLLFTISILTVIRIILRASPYEYGFYMLDLSLICYYIFFFQIIKSAIQRMQINHFSIEFFLSALVCLFLFLISPYWRISSYFYGHKNVAVDTAKGKMFCFPDNTTLRFFQTVDYLKKNTLPHNTIVVVPEGVGINFYSGRSNPLRYYSFLPLFCKLIGEEKIIDEFKKQEIDYFIIIHRPTAEYGYPFFGVDYGKQIFSWIKEHYEIIEQFGPMPFTSKEFGIAVFKRKVIQN